MPKQFKDFPLASRIGALLFFAAVVALFVIVAGAAAGVVQWLFMIGWKVVT